MSDEPRVLFLDIETGPNLGYVWAKYDQNVIKYESETIMLAVSWKWYGESRAQVRGLPHFDGYEAGSQDDTALVAFTLGLLDEADVVIGHNLDKFDIRKINAYALVNDLRPPSPYDTVDTLKVARRIGYFNDNRLGALCDRLGLPIQKGSAGGFDTWLGCLAGDDKAWAAMCKYARIDAEVLEPLYERLRPWIKGHPTMSFSNQLECSRCASENVIKRGVRRTKVSTFQLYQCKDCGGYSRERLSDRLAEKPRLVST